MSRFYRIGCKVYYQADDGKRYAIEYPSPEMAKLGCDRLNQMLLKTDNKINPPELLRD